MNKATLEEINHIIAKKLWLSRIGQGYSRVEIAKKIGVTQQQMEKYEKSINRIPASVLSLVSKHLNITPSYFYSELEVPYFTSETARSCYELTKNFLQIQNKKDQRVMVALCKLLSDKKSIIYANDDNKAEE